MPGMKTYRLWKTKEYKNWLDGLDAQTRKRIERRVRMARAGHFGDHEGVGGKVSEMRLDFGPGYRVYFNLMRNELILLALGGGDKSTQRADIRRAKAMLPEAVARVKQALEEEKKREQARR